MSSKIDSALFHYVDSLRLRDQQRGLVQKRVDQMMKSLQHTGLCVAGSKLIGSYARGTMIDPLKQGNIDVLVELDESKYRHWHNPEATHHMMRVFNEHLKYAFKNVPVEQGDREVRLQFPEFRLDVTPALRWHTGAYLIPDTKQEKILYIDPDKLTERIQMMDEQHNALFIPLIQIAKAWNRRMENMLQDFHLECLVLRRYDGTMRFGTLIQSLPVAVCDFFLALPSMLEQPCSDPIHNQRVDLYLGYGKSHRRDMVVDRSEQSAAFAGAAYDAMYEDNETEAVTHFGRLLGTEFLVPVGLRQRIA